MTSETQPLCPSSPAFPPVFSLAPPHSAFISSLPWAWARGLQWHLGTGIPSDGSRGEMFIAKLGIKGKIPSRATARLVRGSRGDGALGASRLGTNCNVVLSQKECISVQRRPFVFHSFSLLSQPGQNLFLPVLREAGTWEGPTLLLRGQPGGDTQLCSAPCLSPGAELSSTTQFRPASLTHHSLNFDLLMGRDCLSLRAQCWEAHLGPSGEH